MLMAQEEKRKLGTELNLRIPNEPFNHTIPTRLLIAAPFVKTLNWELSKFTSIVVWINN